MILGPIATGAGLLWLKPDQFRKILVSGITLLVCGGVLALAMLPVPGAWEGLPVDHHWLSVAMMVIEAGMGLYVIYVGLRARSALIVALMLAQTGLMAWLEWAHGSELVATHNFLVDKFSVIMALINGVVGGGICLYALGYMREYHEVAHREVADRRPLFFSLLFIFMGAMFGLIFVNNLLWLFLFWEITTLCSFLLIGYTQTEEARRNALLALVMNLAGGAGVRGGNRLVSAAERQHRTAGADHLEAFAGAAAGRPALLCGHHQGGATALLRVGCSGRWSRPLPCRRCCIPARWSRRASIWCCAWRRSSLGRRWACWWRWWGR